MPDRCDECRFYMVDGDPNFAGHCHRFPPQSVLAETTAPPANIMRAFLPRVTPDFWCGEFKHV